MQISAKKYQYTTLILHITFHIFVNFHRINITTNDANVIYFPIGRYRYWSTNCASDLLHLQNTIERMLTSESSNILIIKAKKKYPSRYYSYLFKEAILWKLSIVWNVIFSNIVVYYVFFLLILALIMIFFISLYCCQLRQIFYSSTFHRLPIGLAILAFGRIK